MNDSPNPVPTASQANLVSANKKIKLGKQIMVIFAILLTIILFINNELEKNDPLKGTNNKPLISTPRALLGCGFAIMYGCSLIYHGKKMKAEKPTFMNDSLKPVPSESETLLASANKKIKSGKQVIMTFALTLIIIFFINYLSDKNNPNGNIRNQPFLLNYTTIFIHGCGILYGGLLIYKGQKMKAESSLI